MKSLIPRKYPFEYPSERDFILSNRNDPKALGQFVTDRFQDDFTKVFALFAPSYLPFLFATESD